VTAHEHAWTEVDRHENENRIRTYDACACGRVRFGLFAKRTGTGEGHFEPSTFDFPPGVRPEPNWGIWGPVDGNWHYELGELIGRLAPWPRPHEDAACTCDGCAEWDAVPGPPELKVEIVGRRP
jgi:hypothetical protein